MKLPPQELVGHVQYMSKVEQGLFVWQEWLIKTQTDQSGPTTDLLASVAATPNLKVTSTTKVTHDMFKRSDSGQGWKPSR